MLADEVEDEAARLVGAEAQATAHLLKEHGGARGGAQEEQSVHEGKVDALVEEVAGEEDVDLAFLEALGRRLAFGAGGVSVDHHRRDAVDVELCGHELGVADARAERERARLAPGAAVLAELLRDQLGAAVIAGEEVVELRRVVAAAAPLDGGEVGLVGDAVVLEGHDELLLQRVPEAHFGGDRAVEVGEERLVVGALGGRGEAQEDGGLEAGEDGLVRLGGSVVCLIDDDVLPVVGA